ncbi:MAG: DUF1828 domain-containing protein [Bacteroidetes bacterium]|nr:DUF1828 domain-containing protein [Bacteroidota bacterium]
MIQNIKNLIGNKFEFYPKNDEYTQVVIPMYAEDGDLYELFVKESDEGKYIITDCGITIMRLSYSYEINSDRKREILNKIIRSNNVELKNGEILVETNLSEFENSVFKLAQVIAKVSNMSIYSKEVIKSLFFEQLEEFVNEKLIEFNPRKDYLPLPENPEYKVDYCFNDREKPIYLFGVNTTDKARITTITCQKFIIENIGFKSLIVFEDLDKINRSDRDRLLNVSDKTITSFEFYQRNLIEYFNREAKSN